MKKSTIGFQVPFMGNGKSRFAVTATASLAFLLECTNTAIMAAPQPYLPPIGIPNPQWGGLHPIDATTPGMPSQWESTAVPGSYFIDSTHPAATDNGNPYGHPAKPRLTVPSTLPAGSKVWIDRLNGGIVLNNAAGTESEPVWLIGTGQKLVRQISGAAKCLVINAPSAYVIVDSLTLDGTGLLTGELSGGFNVNSGVHHFCMRNVTVSNFPAPLYNETRKTGYPFSSLDTIVAKTADVSDLVFFKLTVRDNSGGQSADYESGRHAFHVFGPVDGSFAVRRVWLLDSMLNNNSEDAIQVGQSSGSAVPQAVDYLYIGRCEMNRNGENAVDLKACNRVVVSQCTISGYKPTVYRAGAISGSDGVSCVINNDGNGPLESWWIFNRISDCRGGIRNQALTGMHYVIGNIASDMHLVPGDLATSGGSARGTFYWHSSGASATILNNTVYDVEGGFYLNNIKDWVHKGNVVQGIRAAGWPVWLNNLNGSRNIGMNVYHDNDRPVTQDANALDPSDLVNVDPQLAGPGNGDFGLKPGSPAASLLAAVPDAYFAYQSVFGVAIGVDFFGTDRPASPPWAAGAVQGPMPSPRLDAPGGLKVSPVPRR